MTRLRHRPAALILAALLPAAAAAQPTPPGPVGTLSEDLASSREAHVPDGFSVAAVGDVILTHPVSGLRDPGGGPPASQPWLQNAMRADPNIKVFVAAGRYDSLNMCEGNEKMTGKLEPALSARFADHCYEGGHMMYRVQATRLQLAKDLEAFVTGASAR